MREQEDRMCNNMITIIMPLILVTAVPGVCACVCVLKTKLSGDACVSKDRLYFATTTTTSRRRRRRGRRQGQSK